MSTQTRRYRMPDGTETTNADAMLDAWHALMDPVAEVLELTVGGFGNDGANFHNPKYQHAAGVHLPVAVMQAIKRLYDENNELRKEREEASELVKNPPSPRTRDGELPDGFDHNNHDYYALAGALGMTLMTGKRVRGALSVLRKLLKDAQRFVKVSTPEQKAHFVREASAVLDATERFDRDL